MSFVHGGNIISQAKSLGLEVSDLIDMSSNLTPLGPVPGLFEEFQKSFAEIGCLPDATSESLRSVFAEKFSCRISEVIAGNGTTEFIYDLSEKVDCGRVVIVNPTYSDYQLGCEYNNKTVHSFVLPAPDFTLSLPVLNEELESADLVFICNPNNPTGTMTPAGELYHFIKGRADVTFIVDESYLPFTHEPSMVTMPRLDNLFILCSSSKIYGIPGLRLGFMVARETLLKPFVEKQRPWVVNRPAQRCGEFLLQTGDGYISQVVDFIDREKPGFVAKLSAISGIEPVSGDVNFILCRLSSGYSMGRLQTEMLKRRIMIRDCQSFTGLSGQYFRLSLKNKEQNAKCLRALQQCLEE